jgi:hypothetical protein
MARLGNRTAIHEFPRATVTPFAFQICRPTGRSKGDNAEVAKSGGGYPRRKEKATN